MASSTIPRIKMDIRRLAVVDVTDTATEQTIPDISAYTMLLFVAKASSSVRSSLFIPKSLFDDSIDCYIPVIGGNVTGTMYARYVNSTTIRVMTSISTYNKMEIYGII